MDFKEDAEKLFEKYDLLNAETIKNTEQQRRYLGIENKKECRFCGKNYPTVKFKKKAHLIPEFLGNKILLSLFECDECNSYFGTLENEFANFLLPYNSLIGTVGKNNKRPKYKKAIEIYNEDDNLINIKNVPNNLIINPEKVMIPISKEYIPYSIYKILVKIAVSIFPQKELNRISHIISWLMDKESFDVFPPIMSFRSYPIGLNQESIRIVLFQKKEYMENIPSYIFILSYKNYAFQTFLPERKEFENLRSYFPFPVIIPCELDHSIKNPEEVYFENIELSSRHRVKEEITIVASNSDN